MKNQASLVLILLSLSACSDSDNTSRSDSRKYESHVTVNHYYPTQEKFQVQDKVEVKNQKVECSAVCTVVQVLKVPCKGGASGTFETKYQVKLSCGTVLVPEANLTK